MSGRRLLTTGIAGTVITAVCCFTPVLAVLLGLVGLSAWLGWADRVLVPALLAFVALTVFAAVRGRRGAHGCGDQEPRKQA